MSVKDALREVDTAIIQIESHQHPTSGARKISPNLNTVRKALRILKAIEDEMAALVPTRKNDAFSKRSPTIDQIIGDD